MDAPWRVVRARTAAVCDAIIVQTRGGLIEGDRWRLNAHAAPGARARLRATSATIAYSGTCFLRIALRADAGASLALRSSGLVLRAGASIRGTMILEARDGGVVAASEVIGLDATGGGTLRSVASRDDRIVYEERMRLGCNRGRAWRMAGFTHLGSLIAIGPSRRVRERAWVRDLPGTAGAACPRPGCLLVRAVGHSFEELDELLGGVLELVCRA